MNDELMGEETGKWIVLNYFPFNEVKQVMNAHYVEMPDPVRDGWVGSDGRP
jgi:hypothetical protein